LFEASILQLIGEYFYHIRPSKTSRVLLTSGTGQFEIAWTEKCVNLSEEWATVSTSSEHYYPLQCLKLTQTSQWHHSTYSAFCRHNGTCEGSSVGYHSWNEDLVEQARGQLAPQFGTIRQWLESQVVSLTNTASILFQRVLALLRIYETHAPQALGNLFSCMERRKQNINFEIGFRLRQMIESTEFVSLKH